MEIIPIAKPIGIVCIAPLLTAGFSLAIPEKINFQLNYLGKKIRKTFKNTHSGLKNYF